MANKNSIGWIRAIFSGLVLGACLMGNASPAIAGEEGEPESDFAEPWVFEVANSGELWLCGQAHVDLLVLPSTGQTFWVAQTGATYEITDGMSLSFDAHTHISMDIEFASHDWFVEISEQLGVTKTTGSRAGVAKLEFLEPDNESEFVIAFDLSDPGHQLPSLPTVTIKTKKTCPVTPAGGEIEQPGDQDQDQDQG